MRPSFSSARLESLGKDLLVHRLRKPLADGRSCITLKPPELLDRLAAVIPPPRRHRVRYYGVLAPLSALREAVTATAGPSGALAMQLRDAEAAIYLDDDSAESEAPNKPERYRWAMFPTRIHDILPLLCPRCGHTMRLVVFITEPV